MNKKDFAEKYYNLLVLYSDFVEHGFKKNHKMPDFSFVDKVQENITDNPADNNNLKKKASIKKPALDAEQKKNKISQLNQIILNCSKCSLHANSKKITGLGSLDSKIFVLTLPPSLHEEKTDSPLSLESLEFFKKWMEAIGLTLNDVFITNLLKCSLKANPISKEYIEKCITYVDKQIEIIQPLVIITLGQLSLSACKKRFIDLNRAHGELFYYNEIPAIPTYHPSEVLENPSLKKAVWNDLKKIKNFLT